MRPPSRPAASWPPRSPPGGCRPPRPGAADRGPPPRERPGPDAAAAGPDRPGRGPRQLAGGPGPPPPGHRRHAGRGAGLAHARPAPAAWWPASRPRCCAASSTRPGLPAGRLDGAVLDRYLPLGPVRRRGSRYCPSCLAERDGRWLLAWRLGWMFACTAHGVLLCDTCPACGQAPRGRAGRAGLNPPGSCANTIKRHEHCGADLRQVTARPARARPSGAGRPALDRHPARPR